MKKLIQLVLNVFGKYFSSAIRKKSAIIVSLFNAALLTLVTYFMNNSPLFTGENLDLYAGLDFIKGQFVERQYANDSVLLINVAYDKQLAKKIINGNDVGNIDVTDRKALFNLLRNLNTVEKECNYRYIFLDVRFEEGDVTEYDDSLFEEIMNTPRLVFANHSDIKLASDKLIEKAAYTDYRITLTSNNFVRYQYLRNEGESMPLRAYRELYNDSFKRSWWFYTCNKGLCQNTLAINSVLKVTNDSPQKQKGETQMTESYFDNLNLINDKSTLVERAKEKYVVIGNMIEDKHDTFFGEIPGSILVFSAFWALKNGEHIVNPWGILFLYLLFFCISLSLFSRLSIFDRISWIRESKSKFLHFILSFLGYSTVLLMVTIIQFLYFDMISSIWVPALFFSIQKTYFTYKYMKI